MAELLEAALAWCVCKVGLSIACLRVVRGGSLSSVGLCCGCLLLLTDLAIMLFLALLWLADSWLVAFPISADVIALRFLLFLTHTYGGVMVLTIPLVTVEMAFLLRWPHLGGMEGEGDGGNGTQTKDDECRTPLCSEQGEAESREASPEREERQEGDTSSTAILAHAACFLSCLLAWCISGLRTEHRWDQDMLAVELCLEGDTGGVGVGGSIKGSLWHCLPSLLSTAWPDLSEPCWGFPAVMVLLGHYTSLRLISLRPDGEYVCPVRPKPSRKEKEDGSKIIDAPEQTTSASMGLENVKVLLEEKKEQKHTLNADILVQMQTRPTLCALINPSGGVWTQSLTVDTETTASRCHVFSMSTPRSAERRQVLCLHGKSCLSSPSFVTVPNRCGCLVEAERAVRQMQDIQPPTSGQQPLRQDKDMAETICSMCALTRSDYSMVWVNPQAQLPCPKPWCQWWAFPRGSPSPWGLLIAALVWGIFICLFPVPVGFSFLVIQHTETLVLFGLKVLWKT